jgi:hypothetical protein
LHLRNNVTKPLNKTRMEISARAVYALSELIHKETKLLSDDIERELYVRSNGGSSPSSDGSAEMVAARCQIVRALYERMGQSISELNQQAEVLVVDPVLERCT